MKSRIKTSRLIALMLAVAMVLSIFPAMPMFGDVPPAPPEVLASWDFTDATFTPGNPDSPSWGARTVPATGGVLGATASLNRARGNNTSTSAPGHFGTGAAQDITKDGDVARIWSWVHNPDNYAYLEFSTLGYEEVKLAYDIKRSSTSSPQRLILQYSLNGASWATVSNSMVDLANFTSTSPTADFHPRVEVTLPLAAAYREKVFVRWFYSDPNGNPHPPGTSGSNNLGGANTRSGNIVLRNIAVTGVDSPGFKDNCTGCDVCEGRIPASFKHELFGSVGTGFTVKGEATHNIPSEHGVPAQPTRIVEYGWHTPGNDHFEILGAPIVTWDVVKNSRYLVLEFKGTTLPNGNPVNMWGMGSMELSLQGNTLPQPNLVRVLADWTDLTPTTAPGTVVLDLWAHPDYSEFIKGGNGQIMVSFTGNHYNKHENLGRAFLTNEIPVMASPPSFEDKGRMTLGTVMWASPACEVVAQELTGAVANGGPVSFDVQGYRDLKLYYNYTSNGVSEVRLQYRLGDSGLWNNLQRGVSNAGTSDMQTINTFAPKASGSRVEILPAETANQENLQIRWVRQGPFPYSNAWGEGNSFTVSNLKIVSGLQPHESGVAPSSVLAIGSVETPAPIVQRQRATLAAPDVTLREDGGANTAVLWNSTHPSRAKVAGGIVRALSPGTGTNVGQATIRVAASADPSVYVEVPVTITPVDPKPNVKFNIISPYAEVDWISWKQYKAAHHTHTTQSDGHNSVAQAAEWHYDMGFNIVAITDHDVTSITPDRTMTGVSNHSDGARAWPNGEAPRTPLSVARQEEMAEGKGRDGAPGMLYIRGTNEHSGMAFSEITQAPTGHHVNVYGSFLSSDRGTTIKSLLNRIHAEKRGALARNNHPGRYTGAEWSNFPVGQWAQAEVISNDPVNYVPHAEMFRYSHSMIGMEIINKFDTESQADRVLWDNILSENMPLGIPAWGFSDDDSHSNGAIGFSYNLMLMPELSLSAVRNSMDNGAFFAFSRVDRQYGVYPGRSEGARQDGIETWDWSADVRDINDPLYQNPKDPNYLRHRKVLAMPTPKVTSIDVDNDNYKITVNAEIVLPGDDAPTVIDNNSITMNVRWYADGIMIQRGKTLDLVQHQLSIFSYVRAVVRTQYGVLYLQPFEIQGGFDATERVLPNLETFENPVLEFKSGTSMSDIEVELPGAVQIETNLCEESKPRFATVEWDLTNLEKNYNPALDTPQTIKLKGVVTLPTGVKEVTNKDNVNLVAEATVKVGHPTSIPNFTFNWTIEPIMPQPANNLPSVTGEGVSQVGENAHILKLDFMLTPEELEIMRGNDGGVFSVKYNPGGSRRVSLWTDLLGTKEERETLNYATQATHFPTNQNGRWVWSAAVAAGTGVTATINVPAHFLYDEENDKVASTIYIITHANNIAEAMLPGSNRGGGSNREFRTITDVGIYVTGTPPSCAHKWSAWTQVGAAATCVTLGARSRTCTVAECGEVYTQPITAPHTWGTTWEIDVAPTCGIIGWEKRGCTFTDCEAIQRKSLPAKEPCGLKTCPICGTGVIRGLITPQSVTNGKPRVADALEILKEIVGMTPNYARDNPAALITKGSQDNGKPRVADALEILKWIVKMDGDIDIPWD